MDINIRILNQTDHHHVAAMQTNIKGDYVIHSFNKLITGSNTLYGLFVDDQLASVAGSSVFANHSAMLGRLRSDIRFTGKGFATKIMAYIRDETFQNSNIKWVGANTQKKNTPTRRVLEKIGFKPNKPLYGATTNDLTNFHTGGTTWNQIHSLQSKQAWIKKAYLTKPLLFPFACYYLLPAVEQLFNDNVLSQWTFYENHARNRFIITKRDQKRQTYLHTIYPWDDIMEQDGLWETISLAQKDLTYQCGLDTYIWMELTETSVQSLPENHPFELPSPWILYDMDKSKFIDN